eukprot:8726703-Alexandrium_andersonii.AAC.1
MSNSLPGLDPGSDACAHGTDSMDPERPWPWPALQGERKAVAQATPSSAFPAASGGAAADPSAGATGSG